MTKRTTKSRGEDEPYRVDPKDPLLLAPEGSPFNRMMSHDLLTPEEEIKLGRKAKRGNVAAINRLILCNVRFVATIVRSYNPRSQSAFHDLMSAGLDGLHRAAETFDPDNAVKNPHKARFTTFAGFHIRKQIRDHTSKFYFGPISLRLSGQRRFKQLAVAHAALTSTLKHDPTDEELAEHLHWPVWRVVHIRMIASSASLDSPLTKNDGDARMMHEAVADESASPDALALESETLALLEEGLKILTAREYAVVKMRYGLETGREMTLAEVGKEFDLTRERIRQIEQKAVRRLTALARRHATALNELTKE
jgi:RNA polymerase sigma factor (sigma-70 family)